MDGAMSIFEISKTFPKEELFSLGGQTRRAAGSVGMNLMEGAMRLGSKEYRQFVVSPADRQARLAINCF